MLTFVLVIALVILAWFFFKPDWAPPPPEKQIKDKLTRQAGRLKEQSSGWVNRVEPFWKKKASLGRLLMSWALNEDLVSILGVSPSQKEMLAVFQAWIEQLSDAEVGNFAKELDVFCRQQAVDIRWLIDDKGRDDMQKALSDLVLFYGMAVRERANSLPAAALRAWQDAPNAKENRSFGTQLYILLVDEKLISTPAQLLFVPEKERYAHLVNEISELIEKDREALLPYAARALQKMQQTSAPKKADVAAAIEPVETSA